MATIDGAPRHGPNDSLGPALPPVTLRSEEAAMIPTRALSLAAAVAAATPTMGQFSVTFVLSGRTTGTTGGGGTIVGGGTLSLVNVHNLSDAFLFYSNNRRGGTTGGGGDTPRAA